MTSPDSVAAALPQYEIGGELGRGAMGVVMSGTHRSLGRAVAIKQLPPRLAADDAVRARFTSEARLLAGLDHPHVVPVYDYVETPEACLLVLERLADGSVWDRFTRDGLSQEASCATGLAVLAGLSAAHAAGVLHRDIKPENVLLNAAGAPKVGDFGIATVISGDETLATADGQVLGTPAYMSPEQARGERLGPPTDVYATATMLYELLSGRLPIPDDGEVIDVVRRHAYDEAAPIEATVPGPVAAVVMRGLANRVADRYADAESFALDLAAAAGQSYGPGWIERSGVPLQISAGALQAATATAGTTAEPTEPAASIRPEQAQHRAGAAVADLSDQPLVPVARLIRVPDRPIAQLAATAVLILAAVILALVGPAADAGSGGPAVRIDGQPVTSSALKVDLAKPLRVTVHSPGASSDQVRLATHTAGVPTGSASATGASRAGEVRAKLKPGSMRWLFGGRTVATVEVVHAGEVVAQRQVVLDSSHPFIATAEGILGVLALLAGAAYAESSFRQLRRRRGGGSARLVAVFGTAVAGIGGWLTISLAIPRTPLPTTGILCGVLAGLAGGVAASAAAVMGQRQRRRVKS